MCVLICTQDEVKVPAYYNKVAEIFIQTHTCQHVVEQHTLLFEKSYSNEGNKLIDHLGLLLWASVPQCPCFQQTKYQNSRSEEASTFGFALRKEKREDNSPSIQASEGSGLLLQATLTKPILIKYILCSFRHGFSFFKKVDSITN